MVEFLLIDDVFSPLPQLSDLTDNDLPWALAKKLGRLRGSGTEEVEVGEASGSAAKKKKKEAAKTPTGKAAKGGGGGSSQKHTPASSQASATKAQATRIAELEAENAALRAAKTTLEGELRVAKKDAQEIHNTWVPKWTEQTKSLKCAVSILKGFVKSGAVEADLVEELKPISAPYKTSEVNPVRRSPTPPRRDSPAAPSGGASRKRAR